MACDNIKLTGYSFTIVDGYFFYFNNDNNLLLKKNSSGHTVFTYPILDSLGNDVISTEYDGINFWTLQSGDSDMEFIVKMWRIENYLCLKINEIVFDDYELTSLSVEYCSTTLSSGLAEGASVVHINKAMVIDPYNDYEAVMVVGPDSVGGYETNTVSGVNADGTLGLNMYTLKCFEEGTPVSLITNLWIFDNYSAIDDSGTLFRYNLLEAYIDYYFVEESIAEVHASTFYSTYADNYIVFIEGTSLKFFNTSTKLVDKSLFIDNINSAGSIVYSIKDIEIYNGTLFRLQDKVSYYGVDSSYSTYNYQCSPIRSFIDSITIEIYPKILPSDGVSTAELSIIVKDQYSEPSKFKTVVITDDDDEYGYVTISEIMTGDDGACLSYYRAGTSPKTVTIFTLVSQFD